MKRFKVSLPSLVMLSVLGLGSPGKASAQKTVQLGLQLGTNASSVSYTAEPYHNGTLTTTYRVGLAAGLTSQWALSEHWAIQAGLRYLRSSFATEETSANTSTSTGTVSTSHYQTTYRLNRLEAPINFLYFITNTGKGPYVLAGASVGVLLSGKRSYESAFMDNGSASTYAGTDDILVGATYPIGATQYYMRRWDAGLQAGIGYQQGHVGLQAAYRWGFLNMVASAPLHLPSPTSYSRLVEVQACYYFR